MGNAVRILGLDKSTRREFARALALAGAGSQSKWIQTQIRRLVWEQRQKHEDLFEVLTAEEGLVLEIVKSGAAEIQHIIEESDMSRARVEAILRELIERKLIKRIPKGGKTHVARGAKVWLHLPNEN